MRFHRSQGGGELFDFATFRGMAFHFVTPLLILSCTACRDSYPASEISCDQSPTGWSYGNAGATRANPAFGVRTWDNKLGRTPVQE
jgi:hypothetical protein